VDGNAGNAQLSRPVTWSAPAVSNYAKTFRPHVIFDYLYYGTPIEREEEMTAGHKMKMALDAGQMRRLPPWKQEVTDKEGRRRFHGAFTGGFSAGFYNTVGSKEGWAPPNKDTGSTLKTPQGHLAENESSVDIKGIQVAIKVN
jgi:hypothetical protein